MTDSNAKSAAPQWLWPEVKGLRTLHTVEDHLLWCYAMLSVSREVMTRQRAGEPRPFPKGRKKAANIRMSEYEKGLKKIRNLDRDDSLAQNGARVCAHCGGLAEAFHWDHLIPRSRLKGEYVALNQVRSCPRCNTSRGNMDLMAWHRRNRTFPSLGVLRRYLKLCYFHAERQGYLGLCPEEAIKAGLPFDPKQFPRTFPAVEQLFWDHAYPEGPP